MEIGTNSQRFVPDTPRFLFEKSASTTNSTGKHVQPTVFVYVAAI